MKRHFCALAILILFSAPLPAQAPEKEKPLRVLLLAGGPTREFQFCRRLYVNETEQKRAELSIYLQGGAFEASSGVPAERFLKTFPAKLDFDVIVAFDPDWSKLEKEQLAALEKYVAEDGKGLVLVAGPLHTRQLRFDIAHLKPIRDLCPVEVKDGRPIAARQSQLPWNLRVVRIDPAMKFLRLDQAKEEIPSGWQDFFTARTVELTRLPDLDRVKKLIADLSSDAFPVRENAGKELEKLGWGVVPHLEKVLADKPTLDVRTRVEGVLEKLNLDDPGRGFYDCHPVAKIKPAAQVVLAFEDPQLILADGSACPWLVTMPYGMGKVAYLGSGEAWRLRLFRAECHERFWRELCAWAAR